MMSHSPQGPKGPSRPQPTNAPEASALPKAAFEPTVESAAKLGEDMITQWVGSGGEPRVPANRRDEVTATLARCMTDVKVLEAYTGSLDAGWREHRDRPPISGYPARELPEGQIFRDGFAPLDETALGDIAVSPGAVRALHHVLRTVPATIEEFKDPGEWFFEDLEKVMGPVPE